MKSISYSKHAEYKFEVLTEHGFRVSKDQVRDTIEFPDRTEQGRKSRKVMQKTLDEEHVLRVVVEERELEFVVITFYPARRERYEGQV